MTFILSLTLLSLLPLQLGPPLLHPPHHLFDFLALKAAVFFLLILARLLSGCRTPLPVYTSANKTCARGLIGTLDMREDKRLSLGHIQPLFFFFFLYPIQIQQRFALTSWTMLSSPSLSRRIMMASSGRLPAVRRTVRVTWSLPGKKASAHEPSDHKRRTHWHRGLGDGSRRQKEEKEE